MQLTPEQQVIEEFGLSFEQLGVTRMVGRVLGFLSVSEPKRLTMGEIVAGLGAAKSSVSTALRQLGQMRLVEKVSYPGERADYYRCVDHLWDVAMRGSNRKFTIMKELAEKGLDLLGHLPPERLESLQEMKELYQFIETEMPKLIDRWDQMRKQGR